MATATIRATKVSRNTSGRFGAYGGRYVPETLMSALEELEREYEKAKRDRKFRRRLDELLRTFAGRPTPLFFARRLTEKLGGARIYLKREDLLHTGAHKINNCLGDRKSTRLNSSHANISYAVFCLKKKNTSQSQPRWTQIDVARKIESFSAETHALPTAYRELSSQVLKDYNESLPEEDAHSDVGVY